MSKADVLVRQHNYSSYKRGCRCAVCKAANATYMRERRAAAAAARYASPDPATYTVPGIKHGYSGYQNFACRCTVCRQARRAAERAADRRRRVRGGGSSG